MHDFVGSQPKDHIKVPFVTPDGDFVEAYVKVQKHTIETHGSQKLAEAIVGFCSGCKMQATMEFPNGFSTQTGDKAIQGKAVKAFCPRCQKMTEFLPAATYFNHPMVKRNQQHVRDSRGLREEDFR